VLTEEKLDNIGHRLENPSWKIFAVISTTMWCFCRQCMGSN
jgi:hypothetical protein